MHTPKSKRKKRKKRKSTKKKRKSAPILTSPPPLPPRPEDPVFHKLEDEVNQDIFKKQLDKYMNNETEHISKIRELENDIEDKKTLLDFYETQIKSLKQRNEEMQFEQEKKLGQLKKKLRKEYYNNTEKLLDKISELKQKKSQVRNVKVQTDEKTSIKMFYDKKSLDSRNTYKDSYREKIMKMKEKKNKSVSKEVVVVEEKAPEKRRSGSFLKKILKKFPKKKSNDELDGEVSDIEEDGEIIEEEDIINKEGAELRIDNEKIELRKKVKNLEKALSNMETDKREGELVEEKKNTEERINLKFKIKKLEKYISTLENNKRKSMVSNNILKKEIDKLKNIHLKEMKSLKKEIEKVEKLENNDNNNLMKMINEIHEIQKGKTEKIKIAMDKLKEIHEEKTIRLKHEFENIKDDNIDVITTRSENTNEDSNTNEEGKNEDNDNEEEVVDVTKTKEEIVQDEIKKKKDREKKDKTIENILKEFLSSEETYCRDLERLEEYFIGPLKKSIILPKTHEIFKYFGQITLIKNINRMFLTNLKKIIGMDKSNLNALGDFSQLIFNFSHTFKLYSDYVSNYTKFQGIIISLKTDETFWDFIKQKTKVLKTMKVRMYDFEAFLITPVQRIPRYQLFMKDLCKNTSKLSKEFVLLDKAFNTIQSIASFYNDKTKEVKQMEKLIEIQSTFGFENFILPHRQILKEGFVHRVTSNGSKTESEIVLLSDLLLVYSKPNNKKKKKRPYLISLTTQRSTRVVQFEEEMYIRYTSELRKKDKKVRLEFETKDLCMEWLNDIQERLKIKRVSVQQAPLLLKTKRNPNRQSIDSSDKKKRKSLKNLFGASKVDYSDYDFLPSNK